MKQCTGLKPADPNGLADPFVRVSFEKPGLGAHEVKEVSFALKSPPSTSFNPVDIVGALFRERASQTPVRHTTLEPMYNTTFCFAVPAYEELVEHTLVFRVFDWDRFGLNEAMAHCKVALSEVDFRAPLRGEWRDLQDKDKDDEVC